MLTQFKTLLKGSRVVLLKMFITNWTLLTLLRFLRIVFRKYTYKVGYPLRIIVSSVESPLYNLASFLNDILHDSISVANSFIKNSFHLTKNVSNLIISDNEVLLFLDVGSLFTNVSLCLQKLIDLVFEGIERRWHLIERKTNIPKREFFKALELVLNSTIFCFNDKFYKQTCGIPMESPLSPIVSAVDARSWN